MYDHNYFETNIETYYKQDIFKGVCKGERGEEKGGGRGEGRGTELP